MGIIKYDKKSNTLERNVMDQKVLVSRTTLVIAPVVISLLFTAIFGVAVANYFTIPSLLNSYGVAKSLLMQGDLQNLELYQGYVIGELIKNKTILTLDDVWAFQSSFYQTIITFLIALLGILAAVAVFYIRANSQEKAEETVQGFLSSKNFESIVRDKVVEISSEKLDSIQSEFGETLTKVEVFTEEADGFKANIDSLDSDIQDLKRSIKIISEKLSTFDNPEDRKGDFDLELKGD